MTDLSGQKLHLVKRALATAIAALERAPDTHFKPKSDIADMKALLDKMIRSETELERYLLAARLALTGKPDP